MFFFCTSSFWSLPHHGFFQRACEVYKLDPRLDKSDDTGFAPAYSKENYRIQIHTDDASKCPKDIRESTHVGLLRVTLLMQKLVFVPRSQDSP